MKKLLLVAMLGLFSLAASANMKVLLKSTLPACAGMTVTVQFVAYQEGSCIYDITSPVYPYVPGAVYDLCDPTTWFPSVLWMPSYETFTAIICVQCAGMVSPFCLPAVGLDCNPPHACFLLSVAPVPFAGCCFPTLGADCTVGGGGGACMTLLAHM
jgi:hypothetical protein